MVPQDKCRRFSNFVPIIGIIFFLPRTTFQKTKMLLSAPKNRLRFLFLNIISPHINSMRILPNNLFKLNSKKKFLSKINVY